jgi:hypothetical protein
VHTPSLVLPQLGSGMRAAKLPTPEPDLKWLDMGKGAAPSWPVTTKFGNGLSLTSPFVVVLSTNLA